MAQRGRTLLALAAVLAAAAREERYREPIREIPREVPPVDADKNIPGQIRKRRNNRLRAIDRYAGMGARNPHVQPDLRRLVEGRVGTRFWSGYTPPDTAGPGAVRTVREPIDLVRRRVDRYPELAPALTTVEIEAVHGQGRIASLIGIEGGRAIERSRPVLRQLSRLGARDTTLVHRHSNTPGPATLHDDPDIARAPMLVTHSSARRLCDHPRNVPNHVPHRLPVKGGVVMVTLVPACVSEEVHRHAAERRAAPAQVADPVDQVRRRVGISHAGIGSDFDGADRMLERPEEVSRFPSLLAKRLRRGFTREAAAQVAELNVLRPTRLAEAAAGRLQAQEEPSEAHHEDFGPAP